MVTVIVTGGFMAAAFAVWRRDPTRPRSRYEVGLFIVGSLTAIAIIVGLAWSPTSFQ